MKKAFLLLCALLLVLGSALPLAGYRLARAVLGRRADVAPSSASSAAPAAPEAAPAAYEGDADLFLIEDSTTGEVQQVPKRDYLIGAAAAEMPLSWPDEALKAQIVADGAAFLDGTDAVFGQNAVDFVDTSFVTFKQCHSRSPYSFLGSMYWAASANWP